MLQYCSIMYLYFKSRYKNVSELHFLHKNAVKYYSIKLFPHPKTSDGSATLSQNSGAKNHQKIMCFWIFFLDIFQRFKNIMKTHGPKNCRCSTCHKPHFSSTEHFQNSSGFGYHLSIIRQTKKPVSLLLWASWKKPTKSNYFWGCGWLVRLWKEFPKKIISPQGTMIIRYKIHPDSLM